MSPNDFGSVRAFKADALAQPVAEQKVLAVVVDADLLTANLRGIAGQVHHAQWMPL